MNVAFDLIATNIGMGFANTVLLIVFFGNLIFFAQDFKLGIVMNFFTSACLFMLFYKLNLDYHYALAVMLISFVIMSLSLIPVFRSNQNPYV